MWKKLPLRPATAAAPALSADRRSETPPAPLSAPLSAGPPAAPDAARRRLLGGGLLAPWLGGLPAWAVPLAASAKPALGATVLDSSVRGHAVAIGGALMSGHDAVWQGLVARSGGAGAPWVVLGTASESPLRSAEAAAEQLRRRGAQPVVLPVSPLLADRPVAEAVADPALVAQVLAARGVFFTGGTQSRIVDHLMPGGQPSPLLQAIWAVYRDGGVVAGTSAGAAIMSARMFRDAPSLISALRGRLVEGREVGPGLGFMGTGMIVDQHFLKRGRVGRLLPLLWAEGLPQGLGVEENSAVALHDGELEVLGGQAVWFDLRQATGHGPPVRGQALPISNAPDEAPFTLRGARVSLLERGDRLRLFDQALLPAEAKVRGQRLDPTADEYRPYYLTPPYYADFLATHVLSLAMAQLIDGRFDEVRGLAIEPKPASADSLGALGFEFRLYKAPGSMGWYTEVYGTEDYTVHRLGLDVVPVRVAQPMFAPWTR